MTDDARRLIELEAEFRAFKAVHDSEMEDLANLKKKIGTAESYGRGMFIAFGMTIAAVSQFNNIVVWIKKL